MGKELIISGSRHETKVAVLEDDQLVEIYFQRANEYSLAGSIHKGRVTRVLPGMQSAFVNIGLERDAFLYVSDFFEEHEEYDRIATTAEEKPVRAEKTEPPPAVAAAPAETPAGPGREEEGDPRDRRGRRARRRPRGRGFPESKYASELAPPRVPPRHEGPEPLPPPPPAQDFPVLPGESLAKYRRADEEPPVSPDPPEPAEETDCEPEVPDPQASQESSDTPEDWPEHEEEGRLGEPRAAPGRPSAPGGGPAAVQGDRPTASPEEPAPDSVREPLEMAGKDAPEHAQPPGVDDTSEPPQPDQDQGQAEEPQPDQAPPAEEVEPARMPVSLTATLREQGYRYMHRVSRRVRRKTHGGAFPEARPDAPMPPPGDSPEERSARTETSPQPSIAELLREGQEILVQIAKEPLGQKGARITSHIALPGRYVVYMPTVEHLGVSRKIASDEERLRLKRILQNHRVGMPGGFIVRTAGEGRSEHEIATDMQFLFNLWQDMRQKAESRPAPALLHHDLDLVHRILRDQMTDTFKAVWVDNEEIYESVLRFVQRFQPTAIARVKLYTRATPIFDAFNVTSELEKALRPKVWLKSGGYIVINQTEALVAIDVNTGKFVGKSNRLEDTILKTNTEAVKEIVRQVRLRDLGGIIVVDFIDMDERKNRQKVMQTLEEAMRSDRAPNKTLQFNDFGLVAITRKRAKQSLERTLCSSCPYCEGSGYVKSVQTVIGEIIQEAHKIARAVEGKEVMLRVNPEVAKVLKSSQNDYLEELEEILGRPVLVTSDAALQQEKFDLV